MHDLNSHQTEDSDQALFEKAAQRLRELFRKEHGVDFQYGSFEFVFHGGRFQGVDDHPKHRRYRSPSRFANKGKEQEEKGGGNL